MDEPIQIELPDGTVVWARVSGSEFLGADGPSNVGTGQRMATAVEGMTELVQGVAGSLRDAVRAVAPDEVSVQFGLELSAATGKLVSLLADGEGRASIKVALTWRKDGAAPGPPAFGEEVTEREAEAPA